MRPGLGDGLLASRYLLSALSFAHSSQRRLPVWVHRLWFRGTAPILLVLCVALVAMGVWLVASILAAVMVWFLVSLSLRLRRDERKVRDAPKGV